MVIVEHKNLKFEISSSVYQTFLHCKIKLFFYNLPETKEVFKGFPNPGLTKIFHFQGDLM